PTGGWVGQDAAPSPGPPSDDASIGCPSVAAGVLLHAVAAKIQVTVCRAAKKGPSGIRMRGYYAATGGGRPNEDQPGIGSREETRGHSCRDGKGAWRRAGYGTRAFVVADSSKRLLPWLVAVAFFMEQLDTTILNTAVPTIAGALGVAPLSMKA